MAKRKTRSLNKMSRSSVLVAEQAHYGPEPDFTDSIDAGCIRMNAFTKEGKPDPELAYLKSLNWYNAVASPSQHRKWLSEYARDTIQADKSVVAAITKIPESKIPVHITTTARILSRGGNFIPQSKQDVVTQFVTGLVASIKARKQQKESAPADASKSNKPSVQDYMNAQAEAAYGEYAVPLIDIAFESKGAKKRKRES